jgi:predicted peroxiredoxin
MAKFLYTGVHGSEDPTNAAMPFIMANGAVSAGHEAQIFIANEAVDLMKQVVADSVMPVGWPPFKEVLAEAISHRIPIHV